MTPFHDALDALAALHPAGVAACFAADAVPRLLSRAQFPALVVLPVDEQDHGLFHERGAAFEALAFAGGPQLAALTVTHLLLAAPVALGLGARSQYPLLADLLDAYFAALATDLTLGGALAAPAHVTVEPGVFDFGGQRCTGAALRHRWQIRYA